MRYDLPPPPDSYQKEYFRIAFSRLDTVQQQNVTRLEAVEGILLQAPNGSVWKVSVNNSGNLVTTSVALGQSGAPPY
jgi:hypothetical protein